MSREYFENKHGVTGVYETTGRFGHRDPVSGIWLSNLPVFIPETCLDCKHYDRGESGDFGEKLSPPYCAINVFFPRKSGSCKRKKQWRHKS